MRQMSEARLAEMLSNQRMQELRLQKYGKATIETEKTVQQYINNERALLKEIEAHK
jgi:hypothetical protein